MDERETIMFLLQGIVYSSQNFPIEKKYAGYGVGDTVQADLLSIH
jgi:hypothetical protein